MARLYRYANSSDSDGYFLLGHSGEGNTTIQVSQLAKVLLDELGYQPGVLPDDQGPRLPSSLQWALFEADLIGTGGSDVVGDAEDFSDEIDPSTLSEEDIKTIKEFIEEADTHHQELNSLAEALDIEPTNGQRPSFWDMDKFDLALSADAAAYRAKDVLNTENTDASQETAVSLSDTRATITFVVVLEDGGPAALKVLHTVEFKKQDDGTAVEWVTLHSGELTPEIRTEIERQRGILLTRLLRVLTFQC